MIIQFLFFLFLDIEIVLCFRYWMVTTQIPLTLRQTVGLTVVADLQQTLFSSLHPDTCTLSSSLTTRSMEVSLEISNFLTQR